ncbi:hypothetical protein [Pelagovum pacificum]|nr:hypothetical protein [Pelagovum pacificum]QQA42315.1 hypothetical protein I8N54_16200 [Pelagovum pacificum]
MRDAKPSAEPVEPPYYEPSPWVAAAIVSALLSALWFGFRVIMNAVTYFYAPNFCMATVGCRYSYVFAALAIISPLVAFAFISRREKVAIVLVLSPILIACAQFGARYVQFDYHQSYWIGDQQYEIPWRYDPRDGEQAPGGTGFVIKSSVHGLTPGGDTRDGEDLRFEITASTLEDRPPECDRSSDSYISCKFIDGGYSYRVSGTRYDHEGVDINDLLHRFAVLTDSFVVE